MHTGWIIAVCILTDILLERLEPRSHVRVRMSPERLKKIEQGNSVCYYGTSALSRLKSRVSLAISLNETMA